jgi:glycosyltransferase involved in cell wall biosynthesis
MGGSRIVNLTPTLGVLISYYDEGPLLQECLESLLMQEVIPDEILVFDNRAGSYPAESFMRPEWPVKVIHGDGNHGPSHSRNQLWRASQSDYVHFQDADDYFEKDFTSSVKAAIIRNPADVILNQVVCRASDSDHGYYPFAMDELRRTSDFPRFCLEQGASTQCGTVRRDKVAAVGGWDESIWHKEDVDFWFRIALANSSWDLIEAPLIVRRVRTGSHSGNQIQAAIHSYQYLEKLRDSCPRQYEDLLREYAALCAFWLAREGMMDLARHAEATSNRGGRPTYSSVPSRYRPLCLILGVVNAERLCNSYRILKAKYRKIS